MKKGWKIIGIVALAALVGVVAVGAVAFAQTDGSSDEPFDLAARFKEALAGILGISVDEYDAAVEKAQTQVVDQAVAEGRLTEEQAESIKSRMANAPAGMWAMGKGFGGMGRGMGGAKESVLLSVAADKLGMTQAELLAELQGGKTIADLAEEKGVDTQTILDEYAAQKEASLKAKVEDGSITQEQADAQLEEAKTRAAERLTESWPSGGRHGHGRGAPDSGEF